MLDPLTSSVWLCHRLVIPLCDLKHLVSNGLVGDAKESFFLSRLEKGGNTLILSLGSPLNLGSRGTDPGRLSPLPIPIAGSFSNDAQAPLRCLL